MKGLGIPIPPEIEALRQAKEEVHAHFPTFRVNTRALRACDCFVVDRAVLTLSRSRFFN